MTKRLSVVVAADHPGVLQELVSLLKVKFEVVAEADSGKTALQCVRQHHPDVVILDLEMHPLNGIETATVLGKLISPPVVVICSGETNLDIVELCFKVGALGYVFKSKMAQDLVKAVEAAVRGENFVSTDGHRSCATPRTFVLDEAHRIAKKSLPKQE